MKKYIFSLYHYLLRCPAVLRLGMVFILALSMFLGSLTPVKADGPLIPSYSLQDGNRIPAPTGYIQDMVFDGRTLPSGAFLVPNDLFQDPETGNLLVADTGNNRVVVMDGNGQYLFEIGGEKAGLKEPMGVFVDPQGRIWVADRGNKRVAVFTSQGELVEEHFKPVSDYLDDVDFAPSKLVVDKRGFIYVVIGSENNLGVLVIDGTERFRGYFGRARLTFDLGRLIARVLASRAQRERMLRVQPAPLVNLNLDQQGFIYAVSPVLKRDQIQRLNSVGTNVFGDVGLRTGAGRLWDKLTNKEGIVFGEYSVRWTWNDAMRMSVPVTDTSTFTDLAVDDLGIVSVLDSRSNHIYQYDQSGNLLTVFGGTGLSAGMFSKPISIVAGKNGYLYVLDNVRGNIQVFRPTELTMQIHEASNKYFNGDYTGAAVIWGQITQLNTNFSLAHSGLGKALMSQKRYQEAMQEYIYAENPTGYSAAYTEYRYLWMRANFGILGMAAFGILAVAAFAANPFMRGFQKFLAWLRNYRERAGLKVVPVLVLLAIVVRLVGLSIPSFHFREMRPDQIRFIIEGGKILIPWLTWCIATFWVGEIFYGEATLRKITIASAWALWPLIVMPIPISLLTHILSLDEKAIYDVLWTVTWGLFFLEMFLVIKNEHAFEYGQTLLVMMLSAVAIVAIWILLGLVYALSAEIVRFIGSIIMEIYVRLY
jgi:DNA-binding beta-propeller fold protein YncE